jgi:hypothetical protein
METQQVERSNESLFRELGLRNLGKIEINPHASIHGYIILIVSVVLGIAYFYAAILSKILFEMITISAT